MKTYLFLLNILLVNLTFGQNLIPYRIDCKWGYCDTLGKIVIEPQFDETLPFSNKNIAIVMKNKKYGFINSKGKLLTEICYDNLDYFREEYAVIRRDGMYGMIDTTGRIIIPIQNNRIEKAYFLDDSLSQDLYLVENTCVKDKRFYRKLRGKIILEDSQKVIFNDNGIIVCYKTEYGFQLKAGKYNYSSFISVGVNKNGRECKPIHSSYLSYYTDSTYKSDTVLNFSDDFFRSFWSIVNIKTGKIVISELSSKNRYSEGIIPFERRGKWGFKNRNGRTIISPIFNEVRDFKYYKCIVKKGKYWGVIDRNGNIIEDFIYGYIEECFFNIFIMKDSAEKWLLSVNGKKDKNRFDFMENFSEGNVCIKQNEKYGFIDTLGNVIVPCIYDRDYIMRYNEGMAIVKKDGKLGFVNSKGVLVVPCIYDFVDDFSEGLANVS